MAVRLISKAPPDHQRRVGRLGDRHLRGGADELHAGRGGQRDVEVLVGLGNAIGVDRHRRGRTKPQIRRGTVCLRFRREVAAHFRT